MRVLLRIQKTFSCNLYHYIHHAYFVMFLNEGILDIEKPDGICLLTFVEDEFSGLFLHPSLCIMKKISFSKK